MLVKFTHPAVDRWTDESGAEHERVYRAGNVYDLSDAKSALWKNRGCAVDAPRGAGPSEETAAAPVSIRFRYPAGTFLPGQPYEMPADQAAAWLARGVAERVEPEPDAGKAKKVKAA